MNTVVTFHLHETDPEVQARAHQVLAGMGLVRVTASNRGAALPFPESTVLGRTPEDVTLRDLERRIWARLEDAGLRPRRVFAARYDEQGFLSAFAVG